MEFFYDEEALNQNVDANKNESQNDSKDNKGKTLEKDDKTNEVFDKFEDEVGNVYEKATSRLKDIMGNDSSEVNIQIPLMDDQTAAKAQEYIKTLDSNLANVENVATSYWNKVSSPSFWSNVTQNLSAQVDDIVKIVTENPADDEGPLKRDDNDDMNKPRKSVIGGSRTETELRKLSNEKAIYLEYKKDSNYKELNIKDKTDEISALLKDDKDLARLMNKIVPELIAYNEFWLIYFNEKAKILAMEDKRMKLLATKDSDNKDCKDETEEIGWGDDDDEEEDSSVVIVKKEDIQISNESIDKVSHKGKTENDEDDEEDDWE
ncbi:protein Dos2p [Monosporozyma unispora]|nr:hypothetical protein C6P44_000531 [Kazachstania unispora]